MDIEVLTEQEIIHDAMSVLMKYLTPDKLARYWSAIHIGEGDYLTLRERLFEGETAAIPGPPQKAQRACYTSIAFRKLWRPFAGT